MPDPKRPTKMIDFLRLSARYKGDELLRQFAAAGLTKGDLVRCGAEFQTVFLRLRETLGAQILDAKIPDSQLINRLDTLHDVMVSPSSTTEELAKAWRRLKRRLTTLRSLRPYGR